MADVAPWDSPPAASNAETAPWNSPEPASSTETPGRVAGLTAGALLTGAANLPGQLVNVGEGIIHTANAVPDVIHDVFEGDPQQAWEDVKSGLPVWAGGSSSQQTPSALAGLSQTGQEIANKAGLPQPNTPGEREYYAGVQQIPTVATMPEVSPLIAGAGAMSGGLASQVAQEHGATPAEQTLAGLAGGFAGAALPHAGQLAGRAIAATRPTVEGIPAGQYHWNPNSSRWESAPTGGPPITAPVTPPKAAPGPVTVESVLSQPDRLPPPPRAPIKASTPPAGTSAATAPPQPEQPTPGADTLRSTATGTNPNPDQVFRPLPEVPEAQAPKASPIASPETDEAEINSGRTPDTAEQQARLGAVQQLQADTGAVMPNVRHSAVSGDYRETGTDYQLAELGNPQMREQLDQEQQALKTASQQIVNAAGGAPGIRDGERTINESALQERGEVIDRALQGIQNWFKTNVRQIYGSGDAAAAHEPFTIPGGGEFEQLLGNPSLFTGVEGAKLSEDVGAMSQYFGLRGQGGFWSPTTLENAERFRQWLGDQYTPRTYKTIKMLQGALDADVTARHGASTALYEQGRALRAKQDQMLRGPGIEEVMPEKLPNGRLDRSVPVSQIADHIVNLRNLDDFNHIINVLHDSSKLGGGALAKDNVAAINAIRQHMAERLHEAGVNSEDKFWNSRAYGKKIDSFSTKLPTVFSPESIRRMETVRDAGNTLRVNKRYGGAIKQAQQFMQGGGWSPETRERIAGAAQDLVFGRLGAVGELTGIGPKVRKFVSSKLPGGNAATNAEHAYTQRTRPLGQLLKKQGGWIGDLRKSKLPPVTHEYNPKTREHVIRSANGYTKAQQRGDNIQITSTYTDPKATGKGEAVARMARLADEAHANGGLLQSDTSVSPEGERPYPALAHLGYDVRKNPDTTVDVGADGKTPAARISNDGRPVYTVGPQKRPPLKQNYDPAAAIYDAQVKQDIENAARNPNAPRPALVQEGKVVQPQRGLADIFPGQRGGPKFERQAEAKKGGGKSAEYSASSALNNFIRSRAPKHAVDVNGPASWEDLKARGAESPMPINPTLVADIHGAPMTAPDVASLSRQLDQGAIAQRLNDGSGMLEGPKAADWGGAYDPTQFMMHDGATAAQHARQTVTNPQRLAFPGIYDDPKDILSRVKVSPEDPIMQQLFGVSRKDLHDIAVSRTSNMRYELPGGATKRGPQGSKAAAGVMNDANAQRLVNIINETKKNPELYHGMAGWYVMDPLFKKVVGTVGRKAAPAVYSRLNHFMGMASPGSDVNMEISRGTAAHMMAIQGKFDQFVKYGGRPMGARGKPAEILNVDPYHSTAQATPMRQYHESGALQMQSPKVPTYIHASGIPETGFQNHILVGDSHWSRGIGLSDTRTSKEFTHSVKHSEIQQLHPWYREKVAKVTGLPPTSAQAVQWGALSHETGVATPVGAPKLELFARQVKKAAIRMKVTPEEALNRIILGTAYAG